MTTMTSPTTHPGTTPKASRSHNFSAGPAALPEPVLRKAQADLWDLMGTGIGVCEHSHRGGAFDTVIAEAEADCRKLANIPDNYKVLFLQGGATMQFGMIPMNLLTKSQTADYLNTGEWSTRAIKEAQKFGNVNVVCTSEDKNFSYIPAESARKYSAGAAYCHFTSNNTIFGTQFDAEPKSPAGVPLICDASSDIFSRPIDVSKYAMIYAGAQKNLGPSGCALVIMRDDLVEKGPKDLPVMLQYRVHAKDGSRHNTPNTFAIYLMGQVFKWMQEQGGLPAFAKLNQAKADLLYGYLDQSKVFYATAEKGSRSRMNICFRCRGGEDHEKAFLKAADAAKLLNLKGHRSVGGMRASLYNAVSIDSVKALIAAMEKFEKTV